MTPRLAEVRTKLKSLLTKSRLTQNMAPRKQTMMRLTQRMSDDDTDDQFDTRILLRKLAMTSLTWRMMRLMRKSRTPAQSFLMKTNFFN